MVESAAYAKRLSNFDIMADRSIGSLLGFNGKMDELHCAYLLAALDVDHQEIVTSRVARKRSILRLYESMLPGTVAPRRDDFSPSLCVLGGLPARELEAAGAAEGCVFRPYYPLLSRMPALKGIERVSASRDEMATCCALPADVDLHEALKVVDIVRKYL